MSRRPPLRLRAFGLLLAVLALFGQAATGLAVPMPELAGAGAPGDSAFPICHVGSADDAGRTAPPAHHHGLDCALCPLCTALAAVAVLPAPMPSMPPVAVVLARARAPMAARAPPAAAVFAAAYPTGPPRLS